jgi:hypothetical protein
MPGQFVDSYRYTYTYDAQGNQDVKWALNAAL